MSQSNGWIKLHRKMTDWEWYTDIPVKVLYIHLLMKANHERARFRGREIERGETVTSLSRLAAETGLSVMQVRNALKKLAKTGEITTNTTNSFTFVNCCNYCVYQSRELDGQQTDNTPLTNKKQTNNNKQEYKKNKKKKKLSRKPSFDINEIAVKAKLNDDYDI